VFNVDQTKFRVVDVGGQRSERKKVSATASGDDEAHTANGSAVVDELF
jgi:hypothetical protein